MTVHRAAPLATVATDIVRQLHNSPYVAQVMSPWTAPPSASASLISKDGKTGLIVAGITGGESDAPKAREDAQRRIGARP